MALPQNLFELLESTAATAGDNGIIFYSGEKADGPTSSLSYKQLLRLSRRNASLLLESDRLLSGASWTPGSIVVLCLDLHLDSITWYWSVVAAGKTPVVCGPLPSDITTRRKYLEHTNQLFEQPLYLTRASRVSQLDCAKSLQIQTIEALSSLSQPESSRLRDFEAYHAGSELATLMLTSGSSGDAKAVSLRHKQMLTAVSSKSRFHGTTRDDVFLNWIGLDHVANLTEIHLQALFLGANQIQIQATDILASPRLFTTVISRHRVSYTFAPNFFLAALDRVLSAADTPDGLDLTCLRALISGGEANTVDTVQSLSRKLQHHGAAGCVIMPAFGMTETCAGCIYSRNSMQSDVEKELELSSLGFCIPGINMRVCDENQTILPSGQVGDLQLSGPLVFTDYYRNPSVTSTTRTRDGWFITGDQAFIDEQGRLNMTGRTKDSIIINGVNYFAHEIEIALEDAAIQGVSSGFTVVFPYRPKNSATEKPCVVYLPSYAIDDAVTRSVTKEAISRVVVLSTGAKPFEILPLNSNLLAKSSLGKLSRTKIKQSYEQGRYQALQDLNRIQLASYVDSSFEEVERPAERQIASIISETFEVPIHDIGALSSILQLGVSSMGLVRLKMRLKKAFSLAGDLSIAQIITNPTVRGIAETIASLKDSSSQGDGSQTSRYEPVVTLQKEGSKTPLWLVHPGIGEILVFVPLAQQITDRPVHALRARGFSSDEPFFSSIAEIVETYKKAIKRTQPEGPYAIAGYSYGAMLAVEVCKSLAASDGPQAVAFTGIFNLPPHIAFRMRQLDWPTVLLNLAYFVGIIDEAAAHNMLPHAHALAHRQLVLDAVMDDADRARMRELDLDAAVLRRWTDLAHRLQSLARDYEPSGRLESGVDVFVADPLRAVARDRADWVDGHLSRWADFCGPADGTRGGARFHDVAGSHYTMLSPVNVKSFLKELKKSLRARGL